MTNNLKIIAIAITAVFISCDSQKVINIGYNTDSSILSYGIAKLSEHLEHSGCSVIEHDNSNTSGDILILTPGRNLSNHQMEILTNNISGVKDDGFKLIKENGTIYLLGLTERGCLYGIMDIIEQLNNSADIARLEERQVNPAFSFRAIKFNLPWSPYRPGPATDIHLETCRDLDFWESFLDMMVTNRFNALSLWNTHPFPYMIRAENYPEATPFNDQELKEWKSFWRTLFEMAKNRGIETYLVNWNIVVSPEFAEAYGADIYDDRSGLVKKYTSESVTQLINEYEDLTGLGVTLADWMGNWGENTMTPAEREAWIEETFVEGMKNADREIKFIHRAVLAGDPREMRQVIDHANLPDKTIVEVKFNWSHGYSTPNLSITHANDEGTIMKDFWDPEPENYFIAWMIRNEDFFVLRWGDPEFIRQHIGTNHHEYVDGYFVGSEGYIPAKDYSHMEQHPHITWKYAFEKQWLFYHLWGRLLYNPEETDETLAVGFSKRYENIDAASLLDAYSLASKVPLYIASFYKSTWDFTLYSEGFLSAAPYGFDDNKSPFISIEELIKHETLDARYLSISEYCDRKNKGIQISDDLINPLELAQLVRDNCNKAMIIVDNMRSSENKPELNSELDDIETWCYLGFYFADKLRAAVALETFNLSKQAEEKKISLEYLEKCLVHWKNVIRLTVDRYKPMPYIGIGNNTRWPEFTSFHWSHFLKDVEADIEYVMNLEKNE